MCYSNCWLVPQINCRSLLYHLLGGFAVFMVYKILCSLWHQKQKWSWSSVQPCREWQMCPKGKMLSIYTTVTLNAETNCLCRAKGYDPDLLLELFAVIQQGLEVCKAEGSVEAVPIWSCLTNVWVFFVQILQKQTDTAQQAPEATQMRRRVNQKHGYWPQSAVRCCLPWSFADKLCPLWRTPSVAPTSPVCPTLKGYCWLSKHPHTKNSN